MIFNIACAWHDHDLNGKTTFSYVFHSEKSFYKNKKKKRKRNWVEVCTLSLIQHCTGGRSPHSSGAVGRGRTVASPWSSTAGFWQSTRGWAPTHSGDWIVPPQSGRSPQTASWCLKGKKVKERLGSEENLMCGNTFDHVCESGRRPHHPPCPPLCCGVRHPWPSYHWSLGSLGFLEVRLCRQLDKEENEEGFKDYWLICSTANGKGGSWLPTTASDLKMKWLFLHRSGGQTDTQVMLTRR